MINDYHGKVLLSLRPKMVGCEGGSSGCIHGPHQSTAVIPADSSQGKGNTDDRALVLSLSSQVTISNEDKSVVSQSSLSSWFSSSCVTPKSKTPDYGDALLPSPPHSAERMKPTTSYLLDEELYKDGRKECLKRKGLLVPSLPSEQTSKPGQQSLTKDQVQDYVSSIDTTIISDHKYGFVTPPSDPMAANQNHSSYYIGTSPPLLSRKHGDVNPFDVDHDDEDTLVSSSTIHEPNGSLLPFPKLVEENRTQSTMMDDFSTVNPSVHPFNKSKLLLRPRFTYDLTYTRGLLDDDIDGFNPSFTMEGLANEIKVGTKRQHVSPRAVGEAAATTDIPLLPSLNEENNQATSATHICLESRQEGRKRGECDTIYRIKPRSYHQPINSP